MGFSYCVKLLRQNRIQFSFLIMRKNLFGSFSLASVLVAATLVGVDTQIAMACSGGGSSGSGLSHGSSLGAGSVTVCVGSSSGSSGSSYTETITKTVKVPVKVKPKPTPKAVVKAPLKPAPKPTPVKTQVSCPSPAQMASIPRSADAAERWISSICSQGAKAPPISKPTPVAAKPAPKPVAKPKPKTKTITETITIQIPGSSSSVKDAAMFYPTPLRATMSPQRVLQVGQLAAFSSNPSAHFGISSVLGRQAQVHFVPLESGWIFSDDVSKSGADANRSFDRAGKFQGRAWVRYQVSYRLVGETSWQPVAGQLTLESNVLEILVGAIYLNPDQQSQGALLVGADCSSQVDAFGCQI
jgi:hypothetical protein